MAVVCSMEELQEAAGRVPVARDGVPTRGAAAVIDVESGVYARSIVVIEAGTGDIVLRGVNPDDRPVFNDVAIRIRERELLCENLVVRDRYHQTPVLATRGSSVTMQKCVVEKNIVNGPPGTALVEFGCVGASKWLLEDCWFVCNRADGPTNALLWWRAQSRCHGQSVVFSRCVFTGNAAAALVLAERADVVTFRACVVDQRGAPVVAVGAGQAEVEFDHTLVMCDRVEDIVAVWVPEGHETTNMCHVTARGSTFLVRDRSAQLGRVGLVWTNRESVVKSGFVPPTAPGRLGPFWDGSADRTGMSRAGYRDVVSPMTLSALGYAFSD